MVTTVLEEAKKMRAAAQLAIDELGSQLDPVQRIMFTRAVKTVCDFLEQVGGELEQARQRIATLESMAHQPYDFTDLVHRVSRLEKARS